VAPDPVRRFFWLTAGTLLTVGVLLLALLAASRRLVSEPVVLAAGAGLLFRRIDKVAAKGKSAAVVVYELLDPEDAAATLPSVVHAYEEALDDYFARRFAAAASRLAAQAEADAPSRLLLERVAV
jgi:hypothetical protein